jgi:hypothetical protein
MPGRWSTAKIGRRVDDRSYSAPQGLVDPADGAKVVRCKVCGSTGTAKNRLIPGVWTVGSFSMRVVFCEKEVPRVDPRAADPLEAFA